MVRVGTTDAHSRRNFHRYARPEELWNLQAHISCSFFFELLFRISILKSASNRPIELTRLTDLSNFDRLSSSRDKLTMTNLRGLVARLVPATIISTRLEYPRDQRDRGDRVSLCCVFRFEKMISSSRVAGPVSKVSWKDEIVCPRF